MILKLFLLLIKLICQVLILKKTKKEIEDVLGLVSDHAPLISAKTGLNIQEVLEAIVKYIPSPTGSDDNILQALIFDSFYDPYKGIVMYVRIKEGKVRVGDKLKLMATDQTFEVLEIGVRTPKEMKLDTLVAGEVGFICGGIKTLKMSMLEIQLQML